MAVTKRPSTPPTNPSLATDADVYHAYRLILGRDPDPDGLAHYRRRIAEGLTVDALARTFLHSDEHAQRLGQERRHDEAAVDLGGYQVMVRRSDPDFGADIAHWRVYEEPVRAALRELLTVGDTFLDVGLGHALDGVAEFGGDQLGEIGIDHVDMPYTGPKLWAAIREAEKK